MIHFKTLVVFGAIFCLGLVETTDKPPDSAKPRDVNKTIAKVEAILARNPALPRLTRGEILALFENITKTDAAKSKQQELFKSMVEESGRPEHEKSLMVVLPFKTNTSQANNLEELYTRQPITRIVGMDYTTPTVPTSPATERPKRPKKRKNGTRRKPIAQEIRPVYIDESRSTTAQPMIEEINWNPMEEKENRPSVKKQHTNGIEVPHYMQETLDTFQNSNNQIFVTVPPQKSTMSPQVPTTTKETSTPVPNISVAAQSLTPELKNLLVSLGLLNSDGSQVKLGTTTTTTSRPPAPLIQYISINPTVDPTSYIVFKPLPIASSRGNTQGSHEEPLSDDMRQFLARFGLTTDTENARSQKSLSSKSTNLSSTTSTTTTTTTTTTNEPPLKSSGEISEEPFKIDAGFPVINSDILTDDMKDVLENIGLMKKSRKKPKGVIFNPSRTAGLLNQTEEKEKVSKLLSTIKQLSEAEKNKTLSTEEVTQQLQNLTASLVDESKEEDNDSDLEVVEGESSEMNYEGYEPAEEELLKLQNGFIDDELKDDFPLEISQPDNNNQNNELSSDMIQDSINSSNKVSVFSHSLKNTHNPPDPLSSEELNHFVENDKNEIKRQQPNKRQQPDSSTTEGSDEVSSSASPPSTETPSDEPKSSSESPAETSADVSPSDLSSSLDSTAAAAEESTNDEDDSTPSQDDLIDSFGGDNPPENRPNGLYFLVDWNTFLRVGTDNRTVDLNFSPKVGDPKNFLPVTVP